MPRSITTSLRDTCSSPYTQVPTHPLLTHGMPLSVVAAVAAAPLLLSVGQEMEQRTMVACSLCLNVMGKPRVHANRYNPDINHFRIWCLSMGCLVSEVLYSD